MLCGLGALALTNAGWDVAPMLKRGDPLARAARGIDLLILATPDAAIPDVAREVEADPAQFVDDAAGPRSDGVVVAVDERLGDVPGDDRDGGGESVCRRDVPGEVEIA